MFRGAVNNGDVGEGEHSRGLGLGPKISVAEGRARLDCYTKSRSLEA